MAKGPGAKGNIQGTHYDPDSANANRGSIKRRPAPVNQLNIPQRAKIGGQPT